MYVNLPAFSNTLRGYAPVVYFLSTSKIGISAPEKIKYILQNSGSNNLIQLESHVDYLI